MAYATMGGVAIARAECSQPVPRQGGASVSKALRWLLLLSGLCLGVGLAIAAWHQLSKPTTLTLAVGPAGFDDAALVAAWSRALATDRVPLRLSVVPTSGPVEALDRLIEGSVRARATASGR